MSETYQGGNALEGLDDIQLEKDRLRRIAERAALKFVDGPPKRQRVQGSARSKRESASKARTALEQAFPLMFQDALGRKRRMRPVAADITFGPAARKAFGFRPAGAFSVVEVMAIQRREKKPRPYVPMTTKQVGGKLLDVVQVLDGLSETTSPAVELAVLDSLVSEATASVTRIQAILRPSAPKWHVTERLELPTESALASYGPHLPVGDYEYGDGDSLRRGSWSEDGTLLDAKAIRYGSKWDIPTGANWTLEKDANALLKAAGMDDPYEGLSIK